jgi:hypothetical protein
MPNIARMQARRPIARQNLSNARANQYAAINTSRQGKFEARKDRRDGDWGILEFPIWLLWLDAACYPSFDDDFACPVMPVVDLWL